MLGDLFSAVTRGAGGVTPPIATDTFWAEGDGLPGSPPECVTVTRYCPAAGVASLFTTNLRLNAAVPALRFLQL